MDSPLPESACGDLRRHSHRIHMLPAGLSGLRLEYELAHEQDTQAQSSVLMDHTLTEQRIGVLWMFQNELNDMTKKMQGDCQMLKLETGQQHKGSSHQSPLHHLVLHLRLLLHLLY